MRGRILISRITALISVVLLSMSGIAGIGYADNTTGEPHFHDDTASRSVAENTPSGNNIGSAVTAHSTSYLTRYVITGTDAASFSIDGDSGQLKTSAALDYETKTSYSVTVAVQLGEINPASDHITGPIVYKYRDKDTIAVTINVLDVHFDSDSTTRSVAENTSANQNIGSPITADNFVSAHYDYALGGTDSSSFSIDANSGQLKTKSSLDYEVKNSYSVTVKAKAGSHEEDSISVTVNVTNGPDTSCPSGYTLSNNDCLLIVYGVGFGEADPLPPISSDDAARLASLLSMDKIVFNELLNASTDTNDWVELRNVTDQDIDLGGWELSVFTSGGTNAVPLPEGAVVPAGGVLLLLNTDPNAPWNSLEHSEDVPFLLHEWFVLPPEEFTLLLRSPAGPEDAAGNYFFGFESPPTAPQLTADTAWHRAQPSSLGTQGEAWMESGYHAGLGYDAGIPEAMSLGTPGYLHVMLTGDLNGDGTVNIFDLVIVASKFGETGETAADLNGDGSVDIFDLVMVASAFSAAAPPSVHALGAVHVQAWLEEASRSVHTSDSRSEFSVAYEQGMFTLEQILTSLLPETTALLANYPNPFNPETWIPYQLSKPSEVMLTVYSATGTVVRTLELGHQAAGVYDSQSRAAYWDGRNDSGETVASGIYFYTLNAGEFSATRKMLIRK